MRWILGILVVIFGAAYFQLTGWYPNVSWLRGTFFQFAWPLAVTMGCLCLILFARLLNPRDPVLVGWLAFSLCGCLLLVPLLMAKSLQENHDYSAHNELTALHEQVKDSLRRQEQEAINKIKTARTSRTKDRFTQYEGRLDALSLERIRALDEKMQQSLKRKSDDYKLALENNPTRGPDEWLTARSREEIEAERAAHQNLYEAARGFTQYVESFEQSYNEAINELDLKPPADRVAIAEMERILQYAEANKAYELRKLDVEVIGAALAALNVLYDDWGNWSFDRRQQSLSFDDAASEAAFYKALQRLKGATDAVEALNLDSVPEN